jgi:hypothetical protein
MSYKWKSTGHINALEAIAILDLLRKLGHSKANHFQRTLLLVDNTTVVGILAKGRTTSRSLRNPLRRTAAVLVATGTRLVVAWVKSEWNPADVPNVMPRTKQVLAKRTQAERQNTRHALGRLAHQVVAAKTEDRYFTSVSRFLDFLKVSRKRYPSSFILLDRDVCEFVEYLWEQGDPRSWASDCLSGLGHLIASCKPYLVGSWRLHAAWGRTELPVRDPPFTPVLLYGLAQLAAENGWTDIAVLLILGFHTFARTGELFNARAGDFVLSATSGTWTLPLSKSGQRTGAVESILLTDVYVLHLLKNFIKGMHSGDRLSNVSPGLLRSRLASLLDQLHITDPYRWYSVRRAGQLLMLIEELTT